MHAWIDGTFYCICGLTFHVYLSRPLVGSASHSKQHVKTHERSPQGRAMWDIHPKRIFNSKFARSRSFWQRFPLSNRLKKFAQSRAVMLPRSVQIWKLATSYGQTRFHDWSLITCYGYFQYSQWQTSWKVSAGQVPWFYPKMQDWSNILKLSVPL